MAVGSEKTENGQQSIINMALNLLRTKQMIQ